MTSLLFTNPTDWTSSMLVGVFSFACRATALLLAAWVATRLLRRASAASRHLVWASSIVGVLALPLLAVVVPEWKVPVVTVFVKKDVFATRETPSAPVVQEPARPYAEIARTPTLSIQDPKHDARSNALTLTAGLATRATVEGFVTLLWLSIALLLLCRLAIANARVSAWQRSSRPVEDAGWLTLLLRLTREFGIERPVVLLENQESDVPVTWGVVYPVILLPAGAEQWDQEQRVAVLTHELAHVKRLDAFTQLLAQLALALLWFHPLVWLAVRRMRLEREHACDDFVLVAGARASRYADDLLGLARRLTRATAPAAAALAMARRSELEGRLLAILDPATKRTAVRRARVGALTLAVVVLAAPLAAFRPAARVSVASQPQSPAYSELTDSSSAARADARESRVESPQLAPDTSVLESLMQRVGVVPPPPLQASSLMPPLVGIRPDTEPVRAVDVQTLIDVTKGAKRMTSDHEKGQLLAVIAKRYVRNDALRDAYLEAVFTMTADHERSKALIALLERDTIPASSTAQVLRSAALMTSDMNRGMVLKRISPATFADSTVQRAYLDVIVAMTSDFERASAISSLVKQRPLTPSVQLALLRATTAISSNMEKANVLLLFVERQTVADEIVRRAFLKAAETLTSDSEYRRVMMAVL